MSSAVNSNNIKIPICCRETIASTERLIREMQKLRLGTKEIMRRISNANSLEAVLKMTETIKRVIVGSTYYYLSPDQERRITNILLRIRKTAVDKDEASFLVSSEEMDESGDDVLGAAAILAGMQSNGMEE